MSKPEVTPEPSRRKFRPHIVRRERHSCDRFYVYAYRGGPLVMQRDGIKPTKEEADQAVLASGTVVGKPQRDKRGRGVAYHRPLFIGELIKQGADSDRWTYFIGEGRRAIKIGAAKCVQSRLKILQAHNSRNLRVLAVVRGGEALESAYHALFAAHRQKNEWFVPHPEIIAEIEYLNRLEKRLGAPA